ncbi:unnamed protein product [Penicillium salamii]|uniref:Uncharacterized protein n=1 Tax=Penicillium salamii TaxID=1612424 RepID=A0A9W4J4J4_9EURO|nr:unnamed protein product [Penicillium salamii]CAG8188959.1 unnamed protein product [Penicillium salamii]CAG8262245.1 unnamed protein product [Penicillium salamii]CAG8313698.1 unnamed protein product [Penicillium salamii]CAG8370606.1 unnamed protein product [Penicillium salamii]
MEPSGRKFSSQTMIGLIPWYCPPKLALQSDTVYYLTCNISPPPLFPTFIPNMPLDLDLDIAPVPRSREENQERAFIAASRRKDRSLDARLESANRASMLHKKRTGKAFHITKEIVEKEAMYEEIDERYQEKRIKMLQAQNMQIEEQFHRHLLDAFAKRASYSNRSSSIASRRASNMTPLPSADASRKMSLDLSHLRSASFSQGPGSMGSPAHTTDGYVLSPTVSYDPNSQPYMNCMNGPESPYANMVPVSAAASSHIPEYVQTPNWTQFPNWSMAQQIPTPGDTPTEAQAVQMWQQQMMQQASEPVQMRQFRDRLASAPELPLQHQAPPSIPPGPTPPTHGHSRGQSQPSSSFNLNLLTQSTHLHANAVSPKVEAFSTESHSTPDFCPTPHTPVSPTNPAQKVEADFVSGQMDPDYTDFSQFAFNLGTTGLPHEREQPFGFDDYIAVDEFTSVSC